MAKARPGNFDADINLRGGRLRVGRSLSLETALSVFNTQSLLTSKASHLVDCGALTAWTRGTLGLSTCDGRCGSLVAIHDEVIANSDFTFNAGLK